MTTLWIGPVFKQRARLDTFHGYGVQDFLEVDPRFGYARGSRRPASRTRTRRGLRVILDIIFNHTGDNWGYQPPGAGLDALRNEPPFLPFPQFYGAADGAGEGWSTALRDEHQQGTTTTAGVARRRLSDRAAGRGSELHARRQGRARSRRPRRSARRAQAHRLLRAEGPRPRRRRHAVGAASTATSTGSRSPTATASASTRSSTCRSRRRATSAARMREFADRLGKRNFLLVGEIAGGDAAQDFVLDHLATARAQPHRGPRHRRRRA